MNKIFGYIALGIELAGAIPAIIALVKAGAISSATLLTVIMPAVAELQSTFNITIPPALVTDIVTAVADAVNTFHAKKAAV